MVARAVKKINIGYVTVAGRAWLFKLGQSGRVCLEREHEDKETAMW